MNIQNLEPGKYSRLSSLRDRIGNAYGRLGQSDDHKKNENKLKLIQICAVTVSAVAPDTSTPSRTLTATGPHYTGHSGEVSTP